MNEWEYEMTDFDESYFLKNGKDFLFVVMQNTSTNPDYKWDISYSKNGKNNYVKTTEGKMQLFETAEEAKLACIHCYQNNIIVYGN